MPIELAKMNTLCLLTELLISSMAIHEFLMAIIRSNTKKVISGGAEKIVTSDLA